MKPMFTSATIKLTAWYLLILVLISLLFSVLIFELSTSEISSRLERLQVRLEGDKQTITLPGPLTLTDLRMNQTKEARTSIFIGLVYMNIAVISVGGVGSYLLARRTLRPIEAAHEAQSRFTSYASHELRTPLAIMKSEIQVALRDASSTRQRAAAEPGQQLVGDGEQAVLEHALQRALRAHPRRLGTLARGAPAMGHVLADWIEIVVLH